MGRSGAGAVGPGEPELRFHNITIYVPKAQLEETAVLYRDVLGLKPVFNRPGHIACFDLLGYDVALCLHEEEVGHPAGVTEVGFWTTRPADFARRASEAGLAVSEVSYADGHQDPLVTDQAGTQVRLGHPPPRIGDGSEPRVHLLCGLVGAGKTTLARQLAAEEMGVRFSLDEWMLRLYGTRYDDPSYVARIDGCKAMIWDLARQVLGAGHDVVLDWNHWSRQRRAESIEAASAVGATPVVHYLDVPVEVAVARALARGVSDPLSHQLDEPGVRHMATILEPPSPEEGAEIVEHPGPSGQP
jgi:predicted kinase